MTEVLEPDTTARYGGDGAGARDPRLDRAVMIRRLEGRLTPEAVDQFVREARLQGALEHPAVVPVLDVGIEPDGRPYHVLREVRGTPLDEVIARRAAGDERFSQRRLLAALVDVCRAIDHAHAQGVAHRDLRSAHVLLGDFGEVYVQGWGRAAAVAEDPDAVGGDIAALGALLFEILCLRPLLAGAEVLAAARAAGRHGPPELLDACAAATRREGTAHALATAIRRWLDGVRDLGRRRDLAARHRERATAALAEGDRATALREAGSAVALAPNDAAAGELLARLVLEAPKVGDPEAAAVVAASDAAERREQARIATGSFIALPAFMVLLLWPGVEQLPIVLAIVVLGFVQMAFAYHAWRHDAGPAWVWGSLVGNVVMLVLFTRVYGPMLGVPAMAATLTLTSLTVPGLRPWPLVPVVLSLTVLATWGAEALGVLPATTWATGSSVVITSDVVALPRGPTLAVLAIHTVTLVAVATNYTRHLNQVNRAARLRLLSQAWHLEQIVGK